jgi:hypothetical protein
MLQHKALSLSTSTPLLRHQSASPINSATTLTPHPNKTLGKQWAMNCVSFPPRTHVTTTTRDTIHGRHEFHRKTFADGFQECYHCATGHPTTLPKDFCLNDYHLRQGHGASRHFLPPSNLKLGKRISPGSTRSVQSSSLKTCCSLHVSMPRALWRQAIKARRIVASQC